MIIVSITCTACGRVMGIGKTVWQAKKRAFGIGGKFHRLTHRFSCCSYAERERES